MLKLGSKVAEPTCEANTELKLRSAWQRNLAMDLASVASFEIMGGHNCCSPTFFENLTTASGTHILWNVLQAPGLAAVHLGLPCGTSSRARELPMQR